MEADQIPGAAASRSIPVDSEEARVHDWRALQLRRFGVPASLADVYADRLDWRDLARLVRRGCPPALALRILG